MPKSNVKPFTNSLGKDAYKMLIYTKYTNQPLDFVGKKAIRRLPTDVCFFF